MARERGSAKDIPLQGHKGDVEDLEDEGADFQPGLVLGAFGFHDVRRRSHAFFTVTEGPRRDELTLDWTNLDATRVGNYRISVRNDWLPAVGRDARRISPDTEVLRDVGRDGSSWLRVLVAGRAFRVLVAKAKFGGDNFVMTVIDEKHERVIATAAGRQLATGFTLIELIFAVVVVVAVCATVVAVVAMQECVPVQHESSVTVGGNVGTGGTAPVTSGTSPGGGPGAGTAPVTSAGGSYHGKTTVHKVVGQ